MAAGDGGIARRTLLVLPEVSGFGVISGAEKGKEFHGDSLLKLKNNISYWVLPIFEHHLSIFAMLLKEIPPRKM